MLPILLSAVSGCVWAGIAYILLDRQFNPGIFGALVTCPGIGILIGLTTRRFIDRPQLARVAIALRDLYLAVIMFAAAGGLSDNFFGSSPYKAPPMTAALQSIRLLAWGVTTSGFIILLWPISYYNHWLISKAWSGNSADDRGIDH